MWWVTLLNIWLLLCVLAVPWIAFVVCLVPFRKILRREWWVLLLLGFFITAFFVSNLNLKHEVLYQAITNTVHEPWLETYRESILEYGRPPLWISVFGVGLPGMGNPYFTAMSPLVSALLLVPEGVPPFAILLLLHFLVAAGGAYLLARSLRISIPGAFLAATVAVFNLWVFRRLQAEIYAAYALAYAWFPLSWALFLNWLRTNKPLHAAYAAVPLTFLGLTMPTMAIFLSIGVNVMVAVRLVGLAWRRRWRQVGRLAVGLVLLGAVAGFLGAPELLGAREQASLATGSNRIAAPVSGEPGSPNQGWRTHVFSAVDFGHLLLGSTGARFLPPSTNKLNGFGVPYAPHDEILVLSLVGLAAALSVRAWRRSTFAVGHLILALVLANIFVSGFLYVAAWHWYPLFTRTGIFPGVGAMLLLLIVIFVGVGVDAVVGLLVLIFRWVARYGSLFSSFLFHRFTVWGAKILVFLAVGAWAAAQVVSPAAVWDRVQGRLDDEHPLFPDYHIATMPIEHRERVPHLALLRAELPPQPYPVRLFCMSDTSQWPSPCLEDSAVQAGFGLVGIGEQSWTPPGYMADTVQEAMRPWNESGKFSSFFHTVLRLSGVQGVVATRELPLPLLEKISWSETPDSEVYGYVSGFLQKERGVEWHPDYLIKLFVHTLPDSLSRVTFVQPVRVTDEPASDEATRELFKGTDIDVGRVAIVHAAQNEAKEAPAGIELRDHVRTASESFEKAQLTFSSPTPGEWTVQGTLPKAGTLLFSQLYYPGFRAWVNGRAVPVERADLFLTAVEVPAGEVSVSLVYAPLPIMLSSLLAAGAVALLLFATARRAMLG